MAKSSKKVLVDSGKEISLAEAIRLLNSSEREIWDYTCHAGLESSGSKMGLAVAGRIDVVKIGAPTYALWIKTRPEGESAIQAGAQYKAQHVETFRYSDFKLK
jgi:hypothetical protein